MNDIFEKGKILTLEALVDYSEGGIVSKQILKSSAGNITLFSFDKGQGLSEHTAPFDAMVQILDGKAEIRIGGTPFLLGQGETIIMPANITHALSAVERFKMLLTMIRG
ncbi:cupin domain-containing protein [Dysgonomonas sp. BGC7]|uniref:cupin domain-containing protein n=1 Tax=Dysgonomonas sp. BGC7 TaxID=1658008 RepID=UPI0006814E0D|nr:cupin domain-containing protein [Dysgonomonas sp. BGC7]MBD8388838.1 cupin domain-containing protein [Dysgonomonas sp. BGC7]